MQPGADVRAVGRGLTAGSPPALTGLACLIGLGVTAMILGTPYLVFGYHSPTLHLILDSVDGCVALLLAYLLYGRFRRSQRLQDLLLSEGLLLLAVAGLGMTLLLSHVGDMRPRTLDVWLPILLRVVAGGLVLAAALSNHRTASLRQGRWGVVTPWALLGGTALLLWLFRDTLPVALEESPPPSAQRPVITGHPLLLVAQAVTALCFLGAAVFFSRQAARRHDELLRWLGPACALAAFARLNYVLFPSLYSDWLYTGDLLRTGSYLLLLVGAAREISLYWSAQARVAVLDDRRRLARELHDGVVQELSYIRIMTDKVDNARLRNQILHACDRGLDEARAAVDALGRPTDESLGYVLHRSVRQVAERHGGHVFVELDETVEADAEQRHALVRITQEAVSNALRHGGATSIQVGLQRENGVHRLVVRDDGSGFDVETASKNGGYGLVSMRDRAAALPGSLQVSSTPGAGTTVEVTW